MSKFKETCIQHGSWGIYCGPDCKQMTDAWNSAEDAEEESADAEQS